MEPERGSEPPGAGRADGLPGHVRVTEQAVPWRGRIETSAPGHGAPRTDVVGGDVPLAAREPVPAPVAEDVRAVLLADHHEPPAEVAVADDAVAEAGSGADVQRNVARGHVS